MLLTAPAASAAPIIWNVSAIFSDGGSLSGFFSIDSAATNDVLLTYSLSVSGGDTADYSAFTYAPADSFSGGGFFPTEVVINSSAANRELLVFFANDLRSPVGSPNPVNVGLSAEFDPPGSQYRVFSSGVASATPEPGTLVGAAAGLGSLAVLMRRRRR